MSLRQRKHAQTRIAIMQAAITALVDRPLEEITVREISERAGISEMTFFNYFPSKSDVIVHYVQVWSVRVQWEMAQVQQQTGSHLQAIQALYATTASLLAETPGVMAEIVAFQALNRAPLVFQPLSRAEYAQLFPQLEGIEQFEGRGVTALLQEALVGALQSGELPPTADAGLLVVMLANIFFATPVTARHTGLNAGELYRRQLALVWRGVRARHVESGQAVNDREQ